MNKCLLDLDGVLANFHSHWHTFHPEYKELVPWPAGEWSIGKAHGISWEQTNVNIGMEFWISMPWMTDGKEILSLVEKHFGPKNICVLSSNWVAQADIAAAGKVQWIEREMPAYAHRYFLGAAKDFLAHQGVLLIDDKDSNVDKFREEGGYAFLLPRPWNRDHGKNAVLSLIDFLDNPKCT